jgi:hypothetical protein
VALTIVVFVIVGRKADALAVLSSPSPPLNEEQAPRFGIKKTTTEDRQGCYNLGTYGYYGAEYKQFKNTHRPNCWWDFNKTSQVLCILSASSTPLHKMAARAINGLLFLGITAGRMSMIFHKSDQYYF